MTDVHPGIWFVCRLRFGEGERPVVEFVVGFDFEHHLAERGVDGDAGLLAFEGRKVLLFARGVDAGLAGGNGRNWFLFGRAMRPR